MTIRLLQIGEAGIKIDVDRVGRKSCPPYFAKFMIFMISDHSLLARCMHLVLVLLVFGILNGCSPPMSQNKPTLKLALGQSSREIEDRSTVKIRRENFDERGLMYVFFDSPLVLSYADESLSLTLPHAAAQRSMPTEVTFQYDKLRKLNSPVLGEYVTIEEAVVSAKVLLKDLQGQGFIFLKDHYAKFAKLNASPVTGAMVPANVSAADDLIPYFLNPDFAIREVKVFILVKNDVEVSLTMQNMRRMYSGGGHNSDEEMRAQEEKMTVEQRRMERAYYLDLFISRP